MNENYESNNRIRLEKVLAKERYLDNIIDATPWTLFWGASIPAAIFGSLPLLALSSIGYIGLSVFTVNTYRFYRLERELKELKT